MEKDKEKEMEEKKSNKKKKTKGGELSVMRLISNTTTRRVHVQDLRTYLPTHLPTNAYLHTYLHTHCHTSLSLSFFITILPYLFLTAFTAVLLMLT